MMGDATNLILRASAYLCPRSVPIRTLSRAERLGILSLAEFKEAHRAFLLSPDEETTRAFIRFAAKIVVVGLEAPEYEGQLSLKGIAVGSAVIARAALDACDGEGFTPLSELVRCRL